LPTVRERGKRAGRIADHLVVYRSMEAIKKGRPSTGVGGLPREYDIQLFRGPQSHRMQGAFR
jgi:hypothetical protein